MIPHRKGLLSHGALAVVVLEARQVGQVDENHGAGEEPLPVTDPEHPFSVAQVQRGRRFVLAKDLEQDLDHCMSHGFTQMRPMNSHICTQTWYLAICMPINVNTAQRTHTQRGTRTLHGRTRRGKGVSKFA